MPVRFPHPFDWLTGAFQSRGHLILEKLASREHLPALHTPGAAIGSAPSIGSSG